MERRHHRRPRHVWPVFEELHEPDDRADVPDRWHGEFTTPAWYKKNEERASAAMREAGIKYGARGMKSG